MKRSFLCCLGTIVGLIVWTDLRAEEPQSNGLIDCGAEKVAIFNDTASSDHRFAVGWTLRPRAGKPPADWSGYDPANPWSVLDKFSWNDGSSSDSDYDLVDGVVDLKARSFTPLASSFPYWPNKNHGNLSVAWSDERQGSRYVLIANDARFDTHDLWLVQIGPKGLHPLNLTVAAGEATRAYMRRRDPKDFSRYAVVYEPTNDTGQAGGTGKTVFGPQTVTVHFEAGIPKDDVNSDDGNITFALVNGAVQRVTKK